MDDETAALPATKHAQVRRAWSVNGPLAHRLPDPAKVSVPCRRGECRDCTMAQCSHDCRKRGA